MPLPLRLATGRLRAGAGVGSGIGASPETRLLYPRSAANLVLNPTINGSTSWAFNTGAVQDPLVSATGDGSGAAKITNYTGTKAEATSTVITTTVGDVYSYGAKLLVTDPKSVMQFIISPFDSNNRAFLNMTGRRYTGYQAGSWIAAGGVFRMPQNMPQIESAICTGTITGAGTIVATVTTAGMTGSPKAITTSGGNNAAIGDTPAVWGPKLAAALNLDADVSALWVATAVTTTSPAQTLVVLTRKAVSGTYPATDLTVNIAITNGTCTGITPLVTSTHTSAGGDSSKVRLRWQRDTGASAGDVWIDEGYLGLGRSFLMPALKYRTPFDGTISQVDNIGNFSVNISGVMTPFFPYAIYQNTALSSYQTYADGGFNAVMFGQMSTSIGGKAKAAANATYAPGGMWFFSELAQYFDARLGSYQQFSAMDASLQTLLADASADRFIGGYLDVETYAANAGTLVLDDVQTTIQHWRTFETGRLLHANSGQDASLRYFSNQVNGATLNTMGSYLSNDNDVCLSIDNLEGFTVSLGIGVISITDSTGAITMTAAQYRRDAYKGLIWGCRGLAVYRDAATPNSIFDAGNSALLAMMLTIRDEIRIIHDTTPILRSHHAQDFTAASSNANVLVGKRFYNGKAYLILLNNTTGSLSPTITVGNLSYTPALAKDVFAVNSDLTITANAFSIALGAYGTAVLLIQ